jgi:rhamnulokinase
MAGQVDGDSVQLEAVHRFANGVTHIDGHLRWDLTRIEHEMRLGLELVGPVESIGIDTWGVDYGLLDDHGRLLAEPVAYRDDRTAKVIDAVHAVAPPEELFAINGLQHLPFTTLYQFASEQQGPLWERAANAVLIPDLLAYRLTGELRTELTNASTTGLLDVSSKEWSTELLDRLDVPGELLPPLQAPGEIRGMTAYGTIVTAIASHDTASAVAGIPATISDFAYIVCGTWSLVGVEVEVPVLTGAARVAKFTNEIGVDNRVRFLRNVGGLWLLQECQRTWQRDDLDHLLADAAALPSTGPRFDADDPALIPPGRMPERIAAAAGIASMSPAETVRSVLDSLADGFSRTVRQAAALTGRNLEVVHLVGGGAQNALLCQLTADAAGIPVLAGPVEATVVGNVVIQARAHTTAPVSLEAIRAGIAASMPPRRFDPR